MRYTSRDELAEINDFVRKASSYFSESEFVYTYGNLHSGSLLALRWGLNGRSIMVVRLSEGEPYLFPDEIGR